MNLTTVLQLVGLVAFVAAAWTVSAPLALVVAGGCLLFAGHTLDS